MKQFLIQLVVIMISICSYPQATDIILKFFRRVWHPLQSRIFRRKSKRRMINGGMLIAIVGGDGAGKTIAIDEISGCYGLKRCAESASFFVAL